MIADKKAKRSVVVILNGISLQKKLFYHSFLPELSRLCNVEVSETLTRNDAISLASKAADRYVDLILAAGGDGTLNQVVNGVLSGRETELKLPAIGLVPIGSGNDFARSSRVKANVAQLTTLITDFRPRLIDVGVISYQEDQQNSNQVGLRYFVNVADIGMGPDVVERLQGSARPLGHGFAYFQSIIQTFISYKPVVVEAVANDWRWKGKLRTLAVSNGKYYGHGLCVGPDAELDDRMFTVFICGDASVLDFIVNTGSLRKGKRIRHNEVVYHKTDALTLTAENRCLIEADGEIIGQLPARIGFFERQLEFLIPGK